MTADVMCWRSCHVELVKDTAWPWRHDTDTSPLWGEKNQQKSVSDSLSEFNTSTYFCVLSLIGFLSIFFLTTTSVFSSVSSFPQFSMSPCSIYFSLSASLSLSLSLHFSLLLSPCVPVPVSLPVSPSLSFLVSLCF